ncbi:MAG TPA: hypothetical protein VFE33_13465 [Thermoanaerobaculia bacterium]|nr:hypothetical protein [Thermoanaerobaculia bacterium]
MRRSVPGRALVALVLLALLLLPPIALAQPRRAAERKAPAERTMEAGLFLRLWSRWTHLWGQEGSGLDPNGLKTQAGTPSPPSAAP